MTSSLNSKLNLLKLGLMVFLVLYGTGYQVQAQASSVNGFNIPNSNPNTDYLGWDASFGTERLRIRHETPDQPILFRTNMMERMRLTADGTIAINATNDNGARFFVFQDEGNTGVEGVISNFDGNTSNRAYRTLIRFGQVTNIGTLARTVTDQQDVSIGVLGTAEDGSGNQYGVYGRTTGFGDPNGPMSDN